MTYYDKGPLQVVIPMAGRGSRFAEAGYEKPKPIIEVLGQPMIELVVKNLRPSRTQRFVFIIQAVHDAEYAVRDTLRDIAPGCEIIELDGVTRGAAETVLAARPVLDLDAPLLIANSDQFIDASIDEFLQAGDSGAPDGLVMTMWADDPKWSFVDLSDNGSITRVVEKEVISNEATVGVYWFRRAGDFLAGADAMIADDERVGGEFYVAPVYNRMIAAGAVVLPWSVGAVGNGMHGLGTPDDLEAFLSAPPPRALA
jgi:NDP-sugar pyrophosphorylase family protein